MCCYVFALVKRNAPVSQNKIWWSSSHRLCDYKFKDDQNSSRKTYLKNYTIKKKPDHLLNASSQIYLWACFHTVQKVVQRSLQKWIYAYRGPVPKQLPSVNSCSLLTAMLTLTVRATRTGTKKARSVRLLRSLRKHRLHPESKKTSCQNWHAVAVGQC